MTVESIEPEIAASEQAESSETSSDGNLTMAEFASELLKSQSEEEVPEQPEEESETAEEAAEEEESEVQSTEEPEESEESESTDPQSVLSKYNLNLDSLSEEETQELARSLSLSAVRRFGDLTAQKKALALENAELQAQAQATPQPTEQPSFLKDNKLHNVNDVKALTKEVENLTTLIEWAEEGLENEVEYDDNGNEYVAKDGDKTYSKADLRRIRASARKVLRKDAPARQQWIEERTQSDQHAIQTFEFLSDGESEEYKLFMQTKDNPLYKPLVEHLPNGNFALGLMIEGMKAVQARQANKSKPKPKPSAPVASVEAGATKPRTENSQRKKALQSAKDKFEKSGNMGDYSNYIKLRDSA